MDKKEKKRLNPVTKILGIIGLILLLIGVAITIKTITFNRTAVTVVGEIEHINKTVGSNGDIHRFPTVIYRYKGSTYRSDLGYYNAGMKNGDKIKLRVDPEDPYNVDSAEGELFGPIICFAMGAVVIAVSVWLEKAVRNNKPKGTPVEAKIKEIIPVTAIVICEDGFGRRYVSQEMPMPGVIPEPGSTAKVYVNANNPEKYYIDISDSN